MWSEKYVSYLPSHFKFYILSVYVNNNNNRADNLNKNFRYRKLHIGLNEVTLLCGVSDEPRL